LGLLVSSPNAANFTQGAALAIALPRLVNVELMLPPNEVATAKETCEEIFHLIAYPVVVHGFVEPSST
jgi:hypothetical protein